MSLTLSSYIEKVKNNELNPQEVIKSYQDRIKKENPTLNAFVSTHEDYVEKNMSKLMERDMCAAPIGIKDIIMMKGYKATGGSHILKSYVAPYSASCFNRLEEAGACVLGHTNTDEFAMGTTSENSCYGGSKNPHDITRIPGGSSGGSASAVAGDLCLAALGTDTGGSLRFPAAMCGLVGMKPTYGTISRFGVMSMASSFDQVGTLTKTMKDAQILLEQMAAKDPNDQTSVERADTAERSKALERKDVKGMRIALPKQCFDEGCDPRILKNIRSVLTTLQAQGAIVEEVDMPLLPYALAAYYTLVPAEVSTNMARYDGMRFGRQGDTYDHDSFHDYMTAIKSEYLGSEVKRRVIVGSYVLSSAHYEGYFLKAQKVRMMIKQSYEKIFADFDCIITPTSTQPARKMGEKIDDPVKMYLEDTYTVPINLAGLPAVSLPCGTVKEDGVDLPVGIQLIANQRREDILFQLGSVIETIVL